jgi:hypothetical protein
MEEMKCQRRVTLALAVIDDGPLDSRLRTQKTALASMKCFLFWIQPTGSFSFDLGVKCRP